MTQEPQVKHQSNNPSIMQQLLLGLFITIFGGIVLIVFEEIRDDPVPVIVLTPQDISGRSNGDGNNAPGSSGSSPSNAASGTTPTEGSREVQGFTPDERIVEPINCPGAYGPSFAMNDRFVVPYGGELDYSSLRSRPNAGETLGRVYNGEGGVITGKPVCKQGTLEGSLIVWPVRTDSGNRDGELIGWMAEGYPSDEVPWIAPD